MIGAFYQCYKKEKACEIALYSFRKAYPTSDIIMINDGGDQNLETIAKKYNAVYSYEKNIGDGNALYFGTVESIMMWLNRLKYAMLNIKEEYVMLIEDDVHVMKPTDINTLKHDINGCNYNVRLSWDLQEYIKKKRSGFLGIDLFFGGCGGCILNKKFFLGIFQDMDAVKKEIEVFIQCRSIRGSDIIISFLTYLYGGTIEMYPGFVETFYPDFQDRMNKNTVEVIHQFKYFY